MGRVDGKLAFVTGGASGLGAATAELLAAEGATVTIADINKDGADAVAARINGAHPGRAFAVELDVRMEDQWKEALAYGAEQMGGLSVLVNNAGIGHSGNLEELSFEEWKRVHEIDLDSVFLGCKHAIPYMKENQPGSIVNISSIAGLIAGHNMAAYNSAKAGVWLLSKSVALHCARRGYNIRSNSVHPTFIDTPILDSIVSHLGKEEALAKLARQVPLGRVGEPKDIAYAVLYLASDESKFMTGAELKLDGGISAM